MAVYNVTLFNISQQQLSAMAAEKSTCLAALHRAARNRAADFGAMSARVVGLPCDVF
jgi:hypothetical protein